MIMISDDGGCFTFTGDAVTFNYGAFMSVIAGTPLIFNVVHSNEDEAVVKVCIKLPPLDSSEYTQALSLLLSGLASVWRVSNESVRTGY